MKTLTLKDVWCKLVFSALEALRVGAWVQLEALQLQYVHSSPLLLLFGPRGVVVLSVRAGFAWDVVRLFLAAVCTRTVA